jgi:hypothetical protein
MRGNGTSHTLVILKVSTLKEAFSSQWSRRTASRNSLPDINELIVLPVYLTELVSGIFGSQS